MAGGLDGIQSRQMLASQIRSNPPDSVGIRRRTFCRLRFKMA
ncbi:hypothetical protein RISK_001115 [Rhodopirellula islandica]|uniref:Uncharacterized protein n=1 Tax=Rhodopirellula islandica TaxID=595434 RepID=A0A0J1BJR9_RHOIS|nr:hypothetical protein RISK_001115 [Rhodopirellula islandica]